MSFFYLLRNYDTKYNTPNILAQVLALHVAVFWYILYSNKL